MAQSIPSDDYTERQSAHNATLVVASAWFGVVIILITAVGHTFSTPFEPSLSKPLIDLLQFVLVALILASFAFMVLRMEEGFQVTAVPLFINIGTLVIVRLVPFAVLWEEVRFQMHFYQYEAIMEKVDSGEWQPNNEGKILLPASYRHLAKDDGRLWTNQTNGTAVFFVTKQRGVTQFAGYYRHTDGRPPLSGEFKGHWRAIVPKRGGWYYCISN